MGPTITCRTCRTSRFDVNAPVIDRFMADHGHCDVITISTFRLVRGDALDTDQPTAPAGARTAGSRP